MWNQKLVCHVTKVETAARTSLKVKQSDFLHHLDLSLPHSHSRPVEIIYSLRESGRQFQEFRIRLLKDPYLSSLAEDYKLSSVST